MKKTIVFLFALVLAFSLALSAFAFPVSEEGDARDNTYGIAKGYVRTKEAYRDDEGSSHSYTWTYNKQGKMVKEVETSKSGDSVDRYITKWTYDKKGNLKKQVITGGDSVITDTYTYSKKGRLTKEAHTIAYEDNSVHRSDRTYTYNKAGKVEKETAYYDDCEDITTYTYNKAGKLTQEVRTQSYEDHTRAQTTTTYTYDKNGNETKMIIVKHDRSGGVDKESYVSVYNDKNLCVKVIQKYLYTNGNHTERSSDVMTYTYDNNGNVIKEVYKTTYEDGSRRTVVFSSTFDDDNRLVKYVTTEKSSDYPHKTIKAFSYNKKGKLVKEATVTKDDNGVEKSIETYTYDKAGNLVEYVCSGSSGESVTTYAYKRTGE